MKPVIQHRNNVIRAILAVVLLVDFVLILAQWKLNSSPRIQPTDLNRLEMTG